MLYNKIVFTQDELPSILPRSSWDKILNFLSQILPTAATPAQQDLPAMGVLQRVQWAGTSSKTISYNFIHLSDALTDTCLLQYRMLCLDVWMTRLASSTPLSCLQ